MTGRGARPLVIAIDAGHGGQDPGAMGMNGTREKDVTLAISRELARQINATPGLKAYLTRDRDMFLPLPQRAHLARAAKADMFISIHADAAPRIASDVEPAVPGRVEELEVDGRAGHGAPVLALERRGETQPAKPQSELFGIGAGTNIIQPGV